MIALNVLALILAVAPIQAQQQAPVSVPRSVLQQYVGEYVSTDGHVSFKVVLDGDTLAQEVSGRRTPYTPLSESLFMWGPVFTGEFVIDQAGGVTHILSNGTGIENRFRRKGSPPEPPPAAPTVAAVHVPKSVLERYVGVYEYVRGQMNRTDLRITVRFEGDALVRIGAGPTSLLTPISETRFKVGNTSAMVEFVVDEDGVMQILGAGFQQSLARRTSKR